MPSDLITVEVALVCQLVVELAVTDLAPRLPLGFVLDPAFDPLDQTVLVGYFDGSRAFARHDELTGSFVRFEADPTLLMFVPLSYAFEF